MKGMYDLFDILSSAAGEYLSLKTECFKKRIVIAMVLSMFFLLFMSAVSFALVMAIGNALGSLVSGAFIVSGIYAVVFLVLYGIRKKL